LTKVKHMRTYKLADGTTKYAFDPSATLRAKLGYTFVPATDYKAAINMCIEADRAFQEYKKTGKANLLPATISLTSLVDAYYSSSRFGSLGESSKRTYKSIIDKVASLTDFHNISLVKVKDAEALYSMLLKSISISYANSCVNVMSTVWEAGIYLELVSRNPFGDIRLKQAPERDISWSEDQVTQFINTADANGIPSIGTLALMAYELCQRPIDCRNFCWSRYVNGTFFITQAKTGAEVQIPATPALAERIAAIAATSNCNPDDVIAPYEKTGNAYSERLYRKKAELIRSLAGLPNELKLADLRRSGATLLGNSGCTEDEIRSITGHKSRQVVSRYVLPTNTMAQSAQRKRLSYISDNKLNRNVTACCGLLAESSHDINQIQLNKNERNL